MSGPNLIDQLAEIRRRQGRDPLPDPTKIAGFDTNDPPPPSPLDARIAEAVPREEFPDYEPEAETPAPVYSKPQAASPLIPPALNVPQSLDQVELMVANENAMYRGRSCVMTPSEKAAVVSVVLKAIKRSIRDQLRELSAMRPRQRKRATVSNTRKKKP